MTERSESRSSLLKEIEDELSFHRGSLYEHSEMFKLLERAASALSETRQTMIPVVRTCEDCGADIYSHSEPK